MAFSFFFRKDINAGIARFEATPGAMLLDVRTPGEYERGHVRHSVNIPLQELARSLDSLPNKDTPIFVYCQSGARSGRAADVLRRTGYGDVTDIGGVRNYRGALEKS